MFNHDCICLTCKYFLFRDGKTIVTASEDNTARVFSLHKPDS